MKSKKIKPNVFHILLVLLSLVIGIILGFIQIKPPRADETSPTWQRMMNNIETWANEPHPSDTAEIEAVRAQLLAEIEEMGLTPVIEEEVYTMDDLINKTLQAQNMTREEWWETYKDRAMEFYGPDVDSIEKLWTIEMGTDNGLLLQNIIVKLDAPNTERGVMFVSHYDSTSGGPGAADDMVAVCSMVEAMRAQTQNTLLQNDLYFLFTDGEEQGLLGALRFVDRHPELKDNINMVVNLEARGNRGGLILFETSPAAWSIIKAAIKSGARPIGFSWAAAVYAMMPNLTDLTAFLQEGYKGINFAVAEGVEVYHQPADSYENLNRASAGQYLSTTMAIADYAARSSLSELDGPSREAVFFPLLPGFMVLMNDLVSCLLCAVTCILAVLFRIIQAKKKELKFSFSLVLTGLLILLSIAATAFFVSGSYLFYIPLFAGTLTAFLKKWPAAHIIAKMAACILTLLLWVPALFLIWVSLLQPMLL